MIASGSEARTKPRLRGWSHAIACGAAVLSTLALCARGGDEIVWIANIIEPPSAVFARVIEPGDRQSH
jgi:hypothetical protein